MKSGLNYAVAVVLLVTASLAWSAEEEGTLAEYQPVMSEELKEMLRNASPDAGKESFMRKCSSCHDHKQKGGHGKGPHLWNIIGRKAGSMPGFTYSDAMRNSGHTWTLDTLNYYLTKTDRAVPGRIMNFRGIRKDSDRAELLAFMRMINDNPPPLP